MREEDPQAPSVIVLDYMMPRCSGPQFREKQLADPGIADVPVILVSAVSDLSARAALLKPYADVAEADRSRRTDGDRARGLCRVPRSAVRLDVSQRFDFRCRRDERKGEEERRPFP